MCALCVLAIAAHCAGAHTDAFLTLVLLCCAAQQEVKPKGPVHMSLARRLAHNDVAVRNKAVKMVTLWLVKRSDIGASDMIKLWKGLFYCYWMSDKAPVQARAPLCHAVLQPCDALTLRAGQDELAERLCGIVHQLGAAVAAASALPSRSVLTLPDARCADPERAMMYFAGLMQTMAGEWTGIDR